MAEGWRQYHDLSKHSPESLRLNPHSLQWANMPDPFRHYDGVPVLDLPADPPGHATGPEFLSQLLFHSAAISASKLAPRTGDRYALRVNPSSGNLHPTEFHFASCGLEDWPDGVYHYRPSSHMAEQRGPSNPQQDAPIVFLLTTIVWREAWKYRDRAYRYCLLDAGHAAESLALAARSMGCEAAIAGAFADDELARMFNLPADELPMLLVTLRREKATREIVYPSIEAIHAATKAPSQLTAFAPSAGHPLPLPPGSSLFEIARKRRSALDFEGGDRRMSTAQFAAMLEAVGHPEFVQLYLYVHRVEGLLPGVYRASPLQLITPGDQRVAAAGLSLGQDLAGNACIAISMIGDLERATATYGDRGYRYVFFEAGAVGQRLYLAAEAWGLGATGIGAFFDDKVRDYLNLTTGDPVYHFAIGYPVRDPRLEA